MQLNSSYPHRKFSAQDGRINKTCKEKLGDKEWDMLYVVGSFGKGKKAICHLAMVYGSVYCADEKYYKEVDCAVRKAMKGLEKVLQKKRPNIKRDMTTNELGKFIDIDPRKHCKLRVRGMYTYMSPYVVFDQTFKESENIFDLFVVIPEEKFKKFENRDKFCEFAKKNGISVEDKKCQDPNGGADIICTFIKYEKKRAAELTTMPQSP